MENQPKSDRRIYSAKYQAQQNQYWRDLKAELEKYRQNCGATVSELADGLDISRQRLYEFFNDAAVGLPITGANLMGLWDCLTEPDTKIAQKLKPEYRASREQLKRQGFDRLLTLSGFLAPQSPQVDQEKTLYRMSSMDFANPQVYRAASRLNSSWIQDDVVRTYLSNRVLDLVLDRGKLDHESHKTAMSDRKKIKQWPENPPLNSRETEVLKKYRQEVDKLCDAGKQEFATAELFELYHSIYEHEILNLHIPNHIEISDCQFRILSVSLNNADEETKRQFAAAEQRLINFLGGSEDQGNLEALVAKKIQTSGNGIDAFLTSNPVIEVAIGCDFSYNHKRFPGVTWRFSSTAPHIRNMFIAVKNGLGYPFVIRGISTRSTGRIERSLIRSEVMLADPEAEERVYQGWWVDLNTIHSILWATIDAVKRWLAEQNLDDISRYYESFQELAEIDEKLFFSRASFYSPIPNLNYKIAEDCVDQINQIRLKSSNQDQQGKYFRQYLGTLNRKSQLAKLTQIHIALLEGDIQEATKFLSLAEEIAFSGIDRQDTLTLSEESSHSDLVKPDDQAQYSILILNASSCLMFYYLLVGKPSFLENKEWRGHTVFSWERNMTRLGEYIRFNSCIDSDAYLYASQFLGTIGYLEFYTAQTIEDIPDLEKAINHLLAAAHYACRIGHMKRALHWLAYVSRIYCRLGKLERARYYSVLAQRELVVHSSLNQLGDVEPLMTYFKLADKVYSSMTDHFDMKQEEKLEFSGSGQDWSMINIYLSKGEIYLLEGNYQEALDCFIKGLVISVYTGFSRLAADSFYNIYRVSVKWDTKTIQDILIQQLIQQSISSKMWGRNEFTRKLANFIGSLEEVKHQDIPIQLQEFSKEIWNDWANVNVRDDTKSTHPLSELVQDDLFLKVLDVRT
jgi:hypothetical protein